MAQIVHQEGRLIISGDLNFFTVMPLWERCLNLFEPINELNLDLSRVQSSNSAGIALIIQWVTYARKTKKNIKFLKVPEHLSSIIAAFDLESMINLNSAVKIV
jgi:phospholipid transport system transporter-binding protein